MFKNILETKHKDRRGKNSLQKLARRIDVVNLLQTDPNTAVRKIEKFFH